MIDGDAGGESGGEGGGGEEHGDDVNGTVAGWKWNTVKPAGLLS